MKRFVVRIVFNLMVALGVAGGGFQAMAQHVHLFAGAESQQQDAKLIMVNGTSYDTNSNGGMVPECFFMSDNDPVLYPGLYQSDATFAALPATLWTGGPAPNCAAPGAYIVAKMISVQGPAGGEVGFWQENEDASQTAKIFAVPTGTLNGSSEFNVSEGITYPQPDPFGHIHGRRFTANIPGLYIVGFQLIDASTAGTGGGPIHSPSKTNYFFFQAGHFVDLMTKATNTVTVKFGAQSFYDYRLEANDDLRTTNWVKVSEFIGNNHSHLEFLSDTNAIVPSRFYRLKASSQ